MADPVAADPRIGTEFAGYRIKRVLGRRGELSVVYVAEDGRGDREVALKLLAPQLAADACFRERFQLELTLAASLDNPNTIPLYEAGEAEGVLFIAMRYVEGADLAKRLARGHLSPAHALSILEPVADALDAAHAHGLIHRGVKPTNILTSHAGHVYLADFGLGRARDQTCAAPEQRGGGGAAGFRHGPMSTPLRACSSRASRVSRPPAMTRPMRARMTSDPQRQVETPRSRGESTPYSPKGWRQTPSTGIDPRVS